MKKPEKLYLYGYIATWVLGFAIPLFCSIEGDTQSQDPTLIVSSLHYRGIEHNVLYNNMQNFGPLITLQLTQLDNLRSELSVKAKCLDKPAAKDIGTTCVGAYLKQKQWYGTNLVDSADINLVTDKKRIGTLK